MIHTKMASRASRRAVIPRHLIRRGLTVAAWGFRGADATLQSRQANSRITFTKPHDHTTGARRDLRGFSRELPDFSRMMTGIRQDRRDFSLEMAGIRQDRRDLSHEMAGIRQDRRGLSHEMAGIRQDRWGLSHDTAGPRQDTAGHRNEQPGFRHGSM